MSDSLKWIDPSNTEYELNDLAETITLSGIKGEWMPGYSITITSYPMLAGGRVRQVRTMERDVDVPVVIRCATRTALYAKMRDLAMALDPNRGEGKLRRTAGSETRDLRCRYRHGLETLRDEGGSAVSGVLTFIASDPYWYAVNESVTTVDTGGSGITWFGRSWFPFMLERSGVFGSVIVENNGDVETYPIIRVYGPGINPRIRNITTGKDMEITATLERGDTIEVDTRPGYRMVRLNGDSRFDLLTGSLWEIETGSNQVQVEMNGSTNDSMVTISWYERYNSA